ncbi:GTPase domain-containing protein [Argonema antarcticum]|uniref:GTPase domain-containing protein n=1 Tax=Argonema antarcticum TaxID=2942763 RepID=UPI0020137579|nr:GTPase domain-containing protein [Argonema antarcticum]MCL1470924.1 GTPase domain-containing protein [Argonema antarcticum A004/B2]
MSVVVIGDRAVGKTSMVIALHDPGTKHVKVLTDLKKYYDPDTGEAAGTSRKEEETLLVEVKLPGGERQIQVRWIDTPGEAWEKSKEWQETKLAAWQGIQTEVSQSQGVLLLLPPQRITTEEELRRPDAWTNNLASWLQFFNQNCATVQHILISIHKADLFCDIQAEAQRWRYEQLKGLRWIEYNEYIRNTYFNKADEIIREYNRQHSTSLRFFITTIKNPSLLELPWIHLASYLAHK